MHYKMNGTKRILCAPLPARRTFARSSKPGLTRSFVDQQRNQYGTPGTKRTFTYSTGATRDPAHRLDAGWARSHVRSILDLRAARDQRSNGPPAFADV